MCVRGRVNLGSGLHVSERYLSRLLSPVKTLEPLIPPSLYSPLFLTVSLRLETTFFLSHSSVSLLLKRFSLSPDLGAHWSTLSLAQSLCSSALASIPSFRGPFQFVLFISLFAAHLSPISHTTAHSDNGVNVIACSSQCLSPLPAPLLYNHRINGLWSGNDICMLSMLCNDACRLGHRRTRQDFAYKSEVESRKVSRQRVRIHQSSARFWGCVLKTCIFLGQSKQSTHFIHVVSHNRVC